ncbi:HD domain-containing phosphohydrolase [Ferrimonas sp.]|uniref:HD domain-containing phosphohydrolase n=1 Tax=Ferrimonas sp. TaxID=2080861 RepID=UPI003A8D68A4
MSSAVPASVLPKEQTQVSSLRRFLLLSIPLSLVFFGAYFYAFALGVRVEQTEIEARTLSAIQVASDHTTHDFETVSGDLRFIANSQFIHRLLMGTSALGERNAIEQAFLNMIKTHGIYDQIRILSVDGDELIRVNYLGGNSKVVERNQLQNKAHRYYFKQAMLLPENTIYISPFDLNMEEGEIEKPYKPMIRFASAVYDDRGQPIGVIVINYLGEMLLQRFRESMKYLKGESVLVNGSGFWLSHPDRSREWGFMFGKNETFGDVYPSAWPLIQAEERGSVEIDAHRHFFETLRPGGTQLSVSQDQQNSISPLIIVVTYDVPAFNWDFYSRKLSYSYPLLFGYPIALIVLWYWSRASAGRADAERGLLNLNLSLENLVGERTKELQATKDATIMSLASLAETRDNETGQHIRRTQQYVRVLAENLQTHPDFVGVLTDEVIEMIYKSAPLHDIGKVGIPDSILMKPGRLTKDEFAVMKTHTILGGDAIDEAINAMESSLRNEGERTFLHYARDIARYHHERWDGRGYPDGLCGEEIPVAARLMALADVYDALVSERVYKLAFSREKTERIILAQSTGQFDPRILEAFKACMDQFWAIRSLYAESGSACKSERENIGELVQSSVQNQAEV